MSGHHQNAKGPEACDISSRIARFRSLDVVETQKGHGLPQPVADLIWSRRLLPVLTRADEAKSPFGTKAPIKGAGDMSITFAACPPGTGPSLHSHRRTYETFTVMCGRFEFALGDTGEQRVTLDPFDTISVPPGICRAFKNISDVEGILQVIITGGVHDVDDIVFPEKTAQEITAYGADYLNHFKAQGLSFES